MKKAILPYVFEIQSISKGIVKTTLVADNSQEMDFPVGMLPTKIKNQLQVGSKIIVNAFRSADGKFYFSGIRALKVPPNQGVKNG